ncbi:MAG: dethiobiotin synthase [Deltaproteobacteria bacterium]|nr:dethiobiotin synthase [Deltaproteobacteria bacterium]
MTALLVTGTDTGVGKTLVTAALAAALTARGLRVGVAKPVETGCARVAGALYPEDAAALAAAATTSEPLDVVCPYRFPDPLAPILAAARAQTTIDVAALVRTLGARAAAFDVLLVEGAGGALVPLTSTTTYADLARALDAPVLLVVGSRLGAINHALLSLEVLAARGLHIAGYVVNRIAPDGDPAAETNTALLRSLTAARFLGELPRIMDAVETLRALRGGGPEAARARARLAVLARAHLDLDAFADSL